jgi:hypothetical protein
VASHHGPDCRGVWWPSGRGTEDLRDLTEKIRSKKTRSDDGKHGRIETRLNAARCQQAVQPGADLILPTGLDDLFVCLLVKVFRGLLGCLCCVKSRGIRVINGAAGGRRVGVLLVAVFSLKESEEGA